jgi:hypothetical protein
VQKLGGSEYDDPEVAGADSPNLELCRKYTAGIKRQQYLELRKLLVRVDYVDRVWGVIGGSLQSCLNQLCEEDRRLLEKRLEEAGQQIEQEFPQLGEFGPDDYAELDEEDPAGDGRGEGAAGPA